MANLKIEGTEKGAAAARLGKAPLALVAKLTNNSPYKRKFENTNSNFPKNIKEFKMKQKIYRQMYSTIKKFKTIETDIDNEREFVDNFEKAFKSKQPWIANSKLMQLTFINMIMSLKEKLRDEYVTDLLFLAQKKGRNIFDFGPFGKLY